MKTRIRKFSDPEALQAAAAAYERKGQARRLVAERLFLDDNDFQFESPAMQRYLLHEAGVKGEEAYRKYMATRPRLELVKPDVNEWSFRGSPDSAWEKLWAGTPFEC